MRLDKYGNPIHNSRDVFNLLYEGKIGCLKDITVDISNELMQLENIAELHFRLPVLENQTLIEYDASTQSNWFIPEEYQNIDIDTYIISKIDVNNQLQVTRVTEELLEFSNRNMYPLLRWLIYFVDTCKENNIVWGVGRGSSVSSYVLFLIGVHKIDSIKFNLSWTDFLR